MRKAKFSSHYNTHHCDCLYVGELSEASAGQVWPHMLHRILIWFQMNDNENSGSVLFECSPLTVTHRPTGSDSDGPPLTGRDLPQSCAQGGAAIHCNRPGVPGRQELVTVGTGRGHRGTKIQTPAPRFTLTCFHLMTAALHRTPPPSLY